MFTNGFYEDPAKFRDVELLGNRPAPLPGIASNTPPPQDLIPYTGRKSQLSSIGNVPQYNDYGDPGRSRQVEQRLSIAEQSNRALLEEVVRLQGDLKQSHRRTEDALAAERQGRQHLTENLRAANDLIGQLGARLKRAEEKVQDERAAVGALVNHTKQVEQAVLGSQQEILSRRDQQFAKIAELRNDLDEANRARDQMERATATLVDEIRTMKSRVDTQQIEYNGVLHELKERSKRLEEDNRQAIYETRKTHDNRNFVDQELVQLKLHINSRLGEIRDALMDIRNRVQQEEAERRQNENQVYIKMNDMQSQIHEQGRKRDESMHALDVIQREREHAADNERLKMQGKIAEIAEEVSKKILHKEIRLREEAQQKFANIEKYLHAEQAARIAHEQAMREENEKRWNALQRLTEDEVLNVREGHRIDKHKQVDGLNKTNDAIETLEKQQAETKKQLEQVMKAEIKSRQLQDKQIEDKIEDVQEKLGVAISTLQQAIGGINAQVGDTAQVAQEQMKALLDEHNQTGLRGLADLDARVMALNAKVAKQEEQLDKKLSETLDALKEERNLKKKTESQSQLLDDFGDWRDSTDKILLDLKERMDDIGPEVAEMNRTNENVKELMKGEVEQESKDRVRDVQMVRQDLDTKNKALKQDIARLEEKIKAGGVSAAPVIPVSQKEKLAQGKKGKVDEETVERIELMDQEINKLNQKLSEMEEEIKTANESVQTVRSHLGMKIQNETKQRKEEIEDLQTLFEEIQEKFDALSGGKSGDKKDDEEEGNDKKDDDKDKQKSDEKDDKADKDDK
ncbi:coiled-coil domain-containing protein 154-like isoform X5 [Ptychodera flava]|uniref:coiled-coil domain-containing protein 154-like isoform X5 n=1 Tax=Ptychodera flava TaxID=63121 RepID=UPI00396A76AA